MEKGLSLVPGERAKEGLLFIRSILENFQIPSWRKYGRRCVWAGPVPTPQKWVNA